MKKYNWGIIGAGWIAGQFAGDLGRLQNIYADFGFMKEFDPGRGYHYAGSGMNRTVQVNTATI